MFYNSGNYGLPLAELAFPQHAAVATAHSAGKDGGAVQAFVLMTQNILTYTLGLTIAAMAHPGGIGKSLLRIFRLPMLPVLAAALVGAMVAARPTRSRAARSSSARRRRTSPTAWCRSRW